MHGWGFEEHWYVQAERADGFRDSCSDNEQFE